MSNDTLLKQSLNDYAPPAPSDDLVMRIMDAVAADDKMSKAGVAALTTPSKSNFAAGWRRVALAAAVLIVAVTGAVTWSLRPQIQLGSFSAQEQTVVILGDRAEATVYPNTHIDYSVRSSYLFWDAEATVTQGNGAVRYRVYSGGPFIVETPSGRVRVTGTEFNVEVLKMNKSSKTIAAASLGMITLVIVYVGSVVLENDHGAMAIAAGQSGRAESGRAPEHVTRNQSPRNHMLGKKEPSKIEIRRLKNKQQREELIKQIKLARSVRTQLERVRKTENQPEAEEESAEKEAFRETVREAVDAVIEDVKTCYDDQLENTPDLGGNLVVYFVINSEKGVGGVIEDVKISDASDGMMRNHVGLSECMIDTIYTLELIEPEVGGIVEISYPFMMQPPDEL